MTNKEIIEKIEKFGDKNYWDWDGDPIPLIDFILKVRRDAVKEAFKAIEIEKEDNESVSEFYSGYNSSVEKIEQKKKEFLKNL